MRVQTVHVAAYSPGSDAHGQTDTWAAPEPVEVYGWAPAPTRADAQPIEGNRRPNTTDREVYPVGPSGGPRALWAFPDGVFEQIGHAGDYSDGPWWNDPDGAFVVWVRKVEG